MAADQTVEQYYGLRGEEYYRTDDVFTGNSTLLEHFKLQEQHEKLCKTTALPNKYTHFIQELRMPQDADTTEGSLYSLIEGVAFDRPIQTFSDETLRNAFTLKPVTKTPNVTIKTNKKKELVETVDAPDRSDKKAQKKKKREREEAVELQQMMGRLIRLFRDKTWSTWMINSKPGNPFIQKITRENCERLGVPNYFEYVAEAMDLTRMQEKNDKGQYKMSILDFQRDLDLIVANAKVFNRPGEPVHEMANEFEQLYRDRIPKATQALLTERKQKKKLRKEKKKAKKS